MAEPRPDVDVHDTSDTVPSDTVPSDTISSDSITNTSTPAPAQLDGATSSSNGVTNFKDSLLASAQSTMSAVNNHPTTQSAKDAIVGGEIAFTKFRSAYTDLKKGPVGQNVKEQSAITKNEFADLAASRQTPDQPAATGQPLTHYHSMFYRLLSWKNPRATAISYAAAVTFIFMARYLPIFRYIFKGIYIVLGLTATAEGAGKLVFGNGLTSQMRPKKYFTIPKASLERLLDDVEQFINFFVIEFQRIVFAENLYATGASFVSALLAYWLIKFTPLWGLSLIGTTVLYMGPLIYISNQELIDSQLAKGREVVGAQASQFKDLAAQHTGRASETIKNYAGEYSSKAQGIMGRATSPNPAPKKQDFPSAPKQDPLPSAPSSTPIEPLGAKPAVHPVAEPL
ncbi:hypothetical protein EJ05DRAFT_501256 [Pseudovirgaria hyperparasitica]|uniref:Reticulon-like protein n=1 Tax=Pseudovirgaria hyperparasitica TaxID=470096 RepID=A0A6A6W6S6_9PEZI|nr:uncharacterized protein EJ05DRAFT_501256 [Pseudovirgaria hyperparasitica]KAF2757734.1 hypothetical protein EJ05DRAFT_501256 [Pseudovirgaria hyperparasitica]